MPPKKRDPIGGLGDPLVGETAGQITFEQFEVVREAYPDPTVWDRKSPYHDPKAGPDTPIWSMVDLKLVTIFGAEISLDTLRGVWDAPCTATGMTP